MRADDGLDGLLAPASTAGTHAAAAGERPTLTPARPAPRPASPGHGAKQRPDPRPLRLAFAVTGIAAASALATAILTPAFAANGTTQVVMTALPAQQAQPSPAHVITYVRLAPGQTAPPQAVVQQLPAPAPRMVVVTTRQSGTP